MTQLRLWPLIRRIGNGAWEYRDCHIVGFIGVYQVVRGPMELQHIKYRTALEACEAIDAFFGGPLE